tara:strand:- start:344 stop:457 length:114 start_codon:yes stop_codon:yes gene_type:complete
MNKKEKQKFVNEFKKTFKDKKTRSLKYGNVKVDIISF